MENTNVSLPNQQALLSAPKNQELKIYVERPESIRTESICKEKANAEQMKKSAEWFQTIAPGSLLYAIFYAVCMYRNTEGITFPFCVGATLYFFLYYAKKFCVTVKKCDLFLLTAMVLLGVITCTTDSTVLIILNKLVIAGSMAIWLLELFYDVTGWSFASFIKAGCYAVFGGIGHFITPYIDGVSYLKLRKERTGKAPLDEAKKQKYTAIAIGVGISIPMLFVIIMLLSSADVFFKEFFDHLADTLFSWELPELLREHFFGVTATIVIMFSLAYGMILYLSNKNGIEEVVKTQEQKWNAYIAITFSSIIGVVYVLFAGIQILGLFMGKLALPDGYTYAGYAREGFFQLAFVCFFNICLVLVCMACFEESKVLKGIMLVLCGCTYIMLVSSAYRMVLYIKVYHLTFLRVFVLWALAVMAIAMAGIVTLIFIKRFPIFRYLLISILVLYVGFAAAHPDYWIATYNIRKAEAGEDVDEYHLLFNLSLDAAVPILTSYEEEILNPEKYFNEYTEVWELTNTAVRLQNYVERIEEETETLQGRKFNISKAVAAYMNGQYVGQNADET